MTILSMYILSKLDLKPSIISTTASLLEIIKTFKDHLSIKNTLSLRRGGCQFKFHYKIILNMDENKGEPNW